MKNLSIQDIQRINELRKNYPEECKGLSDEDILTAFNAEYNNIQLSADQQDSIMSGLEYSDSENVGLKIESTFKLDEEQEAQLRTILEQKISSMEAKV